MSGGRASEGLPKTQHLLHISGAFSQEGVSHRSLYHASKRCRRWVLDCKERKRTETVKTFLCSQKITHFLTRLLTSTYSAQMLASMCGGLRRLGMPGAHG